MRRGTQPHLRKKRLSSLRLVKPACLWPLLGLEQIRLQMDMQYDYMHSQTSAAAPRIHGVLRGCAANLRIDFTRLRRELILTLRGCAAIPILLLQAAAPLNVTRGCAAKKGKGSFKDRKTVS